MSERKIEREKERQEKKKEIEGEREEEEVSKLNRISACFGCMLIRKLLYTQNIEFQYQHQFNNVAHTFSKHFT